MFLPNSKGDKIHFFCTSFNYIPSTPASSVASYNLLDTNGTVLIKNKILFDRASEKQMAVRHANGRDWWHLMHYGVNDTFMTYLVTDDTLLQMPPTKAGIVYDTVNSAIGNLVFNPQGTQFFITSTQSTTTHAGLELFDFQRNNAKFYKTLDLSYLHTKLSWDPYIFDCEFSSNGKFIYITIADSIFQVDLSTQMTNSRKVFDTEISIKRVKNEILVLTYLLPNISAIESSNVFVLDSTNFKQNKYLTSKVFASTLPNHPNYELGPDLNPGFTTNLPDTVLCVGQTFTVTDTSWGHFRRKWEWGDGSFTDTLPVKQHWELLGLLDTFRVLSHAFSQPGTYNLTLHIINDSSQFGYFDSTVSKTFVVLPWCQTPVVQAHTDTVCLDSPLTLSASGDSAAYAWTFTNGTASGQNISHVFTQSGWNVFSLKVSKLGVDTTLIDSVFVQDCIRANLRTESIAFCDSVVLKVYPEITQGQVDSVFVNFQNEAKLCPDSCTFTWLSTSAGSMSTPIEIHLQNSTYDTTFSKILNLKYLYCPEFIEIYPNPVLNQLNIHFRLEKPEQLRLCNAIGQDVLHIELSGNGLYSVDVSALSRGFYHLRMTHHPDEKRGLKESWKLILE